MQPEKIDVNVEEIMREIRAKIQAEDLAASMPPFSQVSINGDAAGPVSVPSAEGEADWPLFMDSLRYMNGNYDIPYYWSFGPASIKTFMKRVVRKLAKCIIPPILAKQIQFNACVVRCMNTVRHFIEGQRHVNELQQKELHDLRDALDQQKAALQALERKQQDALHDLEKRQQAALQALEERQQDALQALEARQDPRLRELREETSRSAEALVKLQDQMQTLSDEGAFSSSVRDANVIRMSAAQSGEDMILEYIFRALALDLKDISYLDLGANHAKEISNTYFFYKKGVRGVLVEANPELIGELKFYRSGDVILNRCLAGRSGEMVDFYILNGDGLSTPDREGAEAALAENPALRIERVVPVETITAQEILDTYFDKAPTIISLDIEGKEMEILNSIDFTRCRPLIMIIESIPYRRHLVVGEKEQGVVAFMQSKGYTEYAFTGINSIFLDLEQLENLLPPRRA